jgi:feruloyl esterase
MTSLGTTLAGLSKFRREWARTSAAAPPQARRATAPTRLREVAGFGSNPGNLRMFEYVPAKLGPAPALVVVLHGCTQTAAGYDHGAGWSTLADQRGFVLVYPEQQRGNNANTCFNWFEPGDVRRDAGEALSIRQMVERAVAAHGIDRSRIFVTGLSAGGAMTGVMLATYPELFAGGAIVAGLPYGAAASVPEAFESMFQGRSRPARDWGDLVRAASPHRGPWPRLSVWHGDADATVKPTNATEIVKQWGDVHGVAGRPALESKGPGFTRQAWKDEAGREVIESFTIAGMAHGTPLAAGTGEGRYGTAGPYLLDVGVSSTYQIARFWGLVGQGGEVQASDDARAPTPATDVRPSPSAIRIAARPEDARKAAGDGPPKPAPHPGAFDVQGVINKALRAAGLMK